MINPDINDQTYQFFIEETTELLQIIEAGLLTLKEDRTTPKIHEIMRAAHSIKGAAASLQLETIKTVAHRLEDIFRAFYSEEVVIDTELETLLLQAYDSLRQPLTDLINTGNFDQEATLTKANPIFTQIEEKLGNALNQANNYIPNSSDLGIDMVASIFEVDVAQGLEQLSTVVAQPHNYDVAEELRIQIEVFSGFAELFDLPGLKTIAQAVLTALEKYPERVLDITQVSIANFQSARQAVLDGDRIQGGSPSTALIALAEGSPIPEQGEMVAETPSLDELVANAIEPEMPATAETPSLDELVANAIEPEMPATTETPSLDELVANAIEPEMPATTETPSLDELVANAIEPEMPATTETSLISEKQELETELSSIATPITIQPTLQIGSQTGKPAEELISTTPNRQSEKLTIANLSVRVDFDRLERMNNLVGEIGINRNGISGQNEQLQQTLKKMRHRFGEFQEMARELQEISERMSLTSKVADQSGIIQGLSKIWSSAFSALKSVLPHPNDNTEVDITSDFNPDFSENPSKMIPSLLEGFLEEMVLLEEMIEDVALVTRESNHNLEKQRQMLTLLGDELMWAKMLPLSEMLQRFPRILRDMSTEHQKPVNLNMIGTDILVDKAMLEKLYDPLLHLLRNAFDHGIESPEIRQQQGKPAQGEIEIRAYHQGSQTIIELSDDGQGLNLEKIGNRAVELGLLSQQQRAEIDQELLLEFIFQPGFSTASQISEISGRGIGLDVVKSQLEKFNGNIFVNFIPGQGTTFTLCLPLTLALAKLQICLITTDNSNQARALALASNSIEEIVVPQAEQIQHSGEQRFLDWQGRVVPIYPLANLLDYQFPLPESQIAQALAKVPTSENSTSPLLIIGHQQQFFALEVAKLVIEQEMLIKPFGEAIAPSPYVYGCTILEDGSILPVIEGAILLEYSQKTDQEEVINNPSDSSNIPQTAKLPRVLVVDDSTTVRHTLAFTLERAGYRVLQAGDGLEALDQLQKSSQVELVICDVEMPNMNGFEFLGQRRENPQLSAIPVAMLTSRSNDKFRKLAMQLGATAYLTKPFIEQELLATIQDLIDVNNMTKN